MARSPGVIEPRRSDVAISWMLGAVRELRAAFAGERRLLFLTVVGLAFVSVSGVLVAKLLEDAMGAEGATRADPVITNWIVGHRPGGLTAAARAVTHLGDPWVVAVVAVTTALLLLLGRQQRLALLVASSTLGAAMASTAAKYAVDRPRPDRSLWLHDTSGPAFPSGHATQSIALYAALAVVVIQLSRSRTIRLVVATCAVLVAATVGASRVYLGVHWTSDVLCGWAVATMWLASLLLFGWAGPHLVIAWRRRAP